MAWAPPAIRTSLPPATARAWRRALSIPSLTKWNVVPAEDPLLEQPLLELHSLAQPVLEARIVGVGHIHPCRSDEPVQRHSYAEEHFAHDGASLDPSGLERLLVCALL